MDLFVDYGCAVRIAKLSAILCEAMTRSKEKLAFPGQQCPSVSI